MHKRPWPLVILAVLQLFTPVGSIVFSAIANQSDAMTVARDIWTDGSALTQFSIFILPLILAGLIYFTRRVGLYLLTASVLFQITMNVLDWRSSPSTLALSMLIVVSLINLALVAYLLLPSVREIFLNPNVRWWERQPRYILNTPAEISLAESKTSCFLHDLSRGGASLECTPGMIKAGDEVLVKFSTQGRDVAIRTVVVYERSINPKFSRYGVRRLAGDLTGETIMIDSLIQSLNAAKVQTATSDIDSANTLGRWLNSAVRSPKAWVPESTTNRKPK